MPRRKKTDAAQENAPSEAGRADALPATPPETFPIVGIGASAGGLAAT
jgi:chemotaxis response regulator CheB